MVNSNGIGNSFNNVIGSYPMAPSDNAMGSAKPPLYGNQRAVMMSHVPLPGADDMLYGAPPIPTYQ